MSATIEGVAAYKVTDNNQILDKAYFEMEYDGKEFNMAGVKNNQLIIMSMTNDEIMELLSRRADPRPIEERLQADFGETVVLQQTPSKKSRSRRRKPKSASSRKTKSKRKGRGRKSSSIPTITKTPAYKRE